MWVQAIPGNLSTLELVQMWTPQDSWQPIHLHTHTPTFDEYVGPMPFFVVPILKKKILSSSDQFIKLTLIRNLQLHQ